MYHIWKRFGSSEHHTILPCKPRYENFDRLVLYDFSLTVKAAPHECVIRTGQHSVKAPNFFKLFKKFWAFCHELIKAPKAYQSLTKRDKAQQSLTQSVGKLNRAWFKAGTPVFTVCHHLTCFVKMSQNLLRSGMKI